MKPSGTPGRWALPLLGAAVVAIAAVNGLDLPLTARHLRSLAGGEPMLDLRPGYTPEEAFRYLALLGDAGRAEYLRVFMTVDLLLPSLFAAALWSALGAGALARARWVGVAAAGVDYLENAAISVMISAFPGRHPSIELAAGVLTALKLGLYALATVGAVAFAPPTLRLLRGRGASPRPGVHP